MGFEKIIITMQRAGGIRIADVASFFLPTPATPP
jgi:hypothetical protein